MEEERDPGDLDLEMAVVGDECEGYESEGYDCEEYVNEARDCEDYGGDGRCRNSTDLFYGIRLENIPSFDTLRSRPYSFHTYWKRRSTYCTRDPMRYNQTLHPHS